MHLYYHMDGYDVLCIFLQHVCYSTSMPEKVKLSSPDCANVCKFNEIYANMIGCGSLFLPGIECVNS